jgi:hypothetical protein
MVLGPPLTLPLGNDDGGSTQDGALLCTSQATAPPQSLL